MDIFDQAIEAIHASGAFQEFRDSLPIFQRSDVPENPVELPGNSRTLGRASTVTLDAC